MTEYLTQQQQQQLLQAQQSFSQPINCPTRHTASAPGPSVDHLESSVLTELPLGSTRNRRNRSVNLPANSFPSDYYWSSNRSQSSRSTSQRSSLGPHSTDSSPSPEGSPCPSPLEEYFHYPPSGPDSSSASSPRPSRASLSHSVASLPSSDGCVSPYYESPYLEASPIFSYRSAHPEPCYDRIVERREVFSDHFRPSRSSALFNMANPLKRKVVILGAPSVGECDGGYDCAGGARPVQHATVLPWECAVLRTRGERMPLTRRRHLANPQARLLSHNNMSPLRRTIPSTTLPSKLQATRRSSTRASSTTARLSTLRDRWACDLQSLTPQDEFSLFPPKYAVGVHGYMLVYSIISKQSFEMIRQLHDKILDQGGQERVPCVIVGQKNDLNAERRVTTAEGQKLAKELNAGFIETSAKDNSNVGEWGFVFWSTRTTANNRRGV